MGQERRGKDAAIMQSSLTNHSCECELIPLASSSPLFAWTNRSSIRRLISQHRCITYTTPFIQLWRCFRNFVSHTRTKTTWRVVENGCQIRNQTYFHPFYPFSGDQIKLLILTCSSCSEHMKMPSFTNLRCLLCWIHKLETGDQFSLRFEWVRRRREEEFNEREALNQEK